MRGAPALQILSLRKSGPSGHPARWFIEPTQSGPANLDDPIQLSRVTSFYLEECSQARASGLFRKLCLPLLKELILHLSPYDEDYSDFVLQLARPVSFPSLVQGQPCSLLSKLERFRLVQLPCRLEGIKKCSSFHCLSFVLNSWIFLLHDVYYPDKVMFGCLDS